MRKVIVSLIALAGLCLATAQADPRWTTTDKTLGNSGTNIVVLATPTLLRAANSSDRAVIIQATHGTGCWVLLSTASTANTAVTNLFTSRKGVIWLAPQGLGSALVFSDTSPFGMWNGYIYGQDIAGTQANVSVTRLGR